MCSQDFSDREARRHPRFRQCYPDHEAETQNLRCVLPASEGSLSRGGETTNVFPFGSAKEKELVLDYRAAKTESEVVETERRPGDIAQIIEIIVRIEFVVPEELKDTTKKLVLAAARHDVDRCARVAARLGREV